MTTTKRRRLNHYANKTQDIFKCPQALWPRVTIAALSTCKAHQESTRTSQMSTFVQWLLFNRLWIWQKKKKKRQKHSGRGKNCQNLCYTFSKILSFTNSFLPFRDFFSQWLITLSFPNLHFSLYFLANFP